MAGESLRPTGDLIGAIVFGLVGLVLGAIIGLAMFDAGSTGRIVLPVVAAVFATWAGLEYGDGRENEAQNR
jgi:hypothetical protein